MTLKAKPQPATCNGCPHLLEHERRDMHPSANDYTCAAKVTVEPHDNWIGFMPVMAEWCPLHQGEGA